MEAALRSTLPPGRLSWRPTTPAPAIGFRWVFRPVDFIRDFYGGSEQRSYLSLTGSSFNDSCFTVMVKLIIGSECRCEGTFKAKRVATEHPFDLFKGRNSQGVSLWLARFVCPESGKEVVFAWPHIEDQEELDLEYLAMLVMTIAGSSESQIFENFDE